MEEQSLSHINSIQSDIKHIQFSLATQELYNQWLASSQTSPPRRIQRFRRIALTPSPCSYLAGEEIKCGRHVATLLLISPGSQTGRRRRQGRRLTEMNFVCLWLRGYAQVEQVKPGGSEGYGRGGWQSKNAIIFQRRRRQRLNVTFKHDVVIF